MSEHEPEPMDVDSDGEFQPGGPEGSDSGSTAGMASDDAGSSSGGDDTETVASRNEAEDSLCSDDDDDDDDMTFDGVGLSALALLGGAVTRRAQPPVLPQHVFEHAVYVCGC